MTCAICLAIEFASPGSKDALIVAQQRQIDRLTGGREEPVELVVRSERIEPNRTTPPVGLRQELELILWDADIHRKPPRVAAPRILAALAAAGWRIERDQIEEAG